MDTIGVPSAVPPRFILSPKVKPKSIKSRHSITNILSNELPPSTDNTNTDVTTSTTTKHQAASSLTPSQSLPALHLAGQHQHAIQTRPSNSLRNPISNDSITDCTSGIKYLLRCH